VVEALTGTFVALDLQSLGTFLIFLLVLFFRPNGILGKGATVK
jgi:branched-subunit amino acid ABC-type transport system permease component